jgi:hypothetical protein
MKNKFILENLQSNEIKEYKSLRDISNELKIDYFEIRELKEHCIRTKKFFHNRHKHLASKYKITYNQTL